MSLTTWILLGGLAGLSVVLGLLPRPLAEEVARLRAWAYRSIIAIEWFLVAIFFSVLLADGQGLARFGLSFAEAGASDLLWAAGVIAITLPLSELAWAQAQRRGWSGVELIRALLPRTQQEKWLALGLALTAGLCEEFLYRGFLITVLQDWQGSIWLAGGASAILFALAHAPYGRLGFLSALTGGALLAGAFLATDRLVAPVLAHVAYDGYAFFFARSVRQL